MDISQKLLAAFQVEHIEHLEGIRACLALWEQTGEVVDIDEAFRRAHSLKGAARITGFTEVEQLAHRLESLFSRVRAKTLIPDQSVLRVVKSALDSIEDTVACLTNQRPPPDTSTLLHDLEMLTNPAATPAPLETSSSVSPGAQRPVLQSLAAHETEFKPTEQRKPVAPVSGPEGPAKLVAAGSPPSRETVRLSAESLDQLLQSTGRLLTENLQQGTLGRELVSVSRQLTAIEREWASLKRTSAIALRRLGGSPEFASVGKFLDFVEHEVNGLARRMRTARSMQKQSSWSVKQLAEQLQDDVRRARMMPAESEFQGFRKMMRDLARDEGKEIDFRVNGFEVLADRMVLQALKYPLMHALRNAVCHGIELPAERKLHGKPAQGCVTLTIQARGNRLTILVEDDGRGVETKQVAEAAVRRNLVSAAEIASRSPQDIARLLFQPGFSTTTSVTELSGRGMGLSIAYETVTRLQGEIELLPGETAGTSLRLSVPLSISTHRLLLVSVRGQVFAIPTYGIESLHRVKAKELENVEGTPMISLHGSLTRLTTLAQLLNLETEASFDSDTLFLVVLRSSTKQLAVAVDALIAERDALIKPLGPPADAMSAYVGGILLEDGTVSLALNPADLVEKHKPSKKGATFQTSQPVEEWQPPTILVVDDSFTTRTLETSILETNGYRVRLAVDGVEALSQLRAGKIDLVISDIQMPRLDGFGLIAEMKRDPQLAKIPVIVVSSVESREEQERGLNLGADAYIVKRKFDHQELLKVIQQIL